MERKVFLYNSSKKLIRQVIAQNFLCYAALWRVKRKPQSLSQIWSWQRARKDFVIDFFEISLINLVALETGSQKAIKILSVLHFTHLADFKIFLSSVSESSLRGSLWVFSFSEKGWNVELISFASKNLRSLPRCDNLELDDSM